MFNGLLCPAGTCGCPQRSPGELFPPNLCQRFPLAGSACPEPVGPSWAARGARSPASRLVPASALIAPALRLGQERQPRTCCRATGQAGAVGLACCSRLPWEKEKGSDDDDDRSRLCFPSGEKN